MTDQLRRAGGLLVVVLITMSLTYSLAGGRAAAQPVSDDWPTSLHDVGRTGASNDTNIAPGAASTLTRSWSFQTGGVIASQVSIVGGTAYFGSWDGYEYAVNAITGALDWKTFTGITTAPASDNCNPPQAGITSAAAVVNGVVYVGGGDGYFYTFNASTGAVEWRVWVEGSNAPGNYDGHYNWSSPLIYNGYAYVGVASFGDCPLVQGQLLQINLSTGAIQNTLNLVPNGQIGGGIWTSPALDPATNTIYTSTGTETAPSEQWAQAVLAINANTLEVTNSWKLPETEAIFDSDFGTSTTLFTDANGDQLLGLINKNGWAYTFDRNDLSAGPIWQYQVAVPGDCPTCGDSSVSSETIGDGNLYVAGGQSEINGQGYPGTVSALNPATGAVVWQHGAPGNIIGALTYDNGMVFDSAGPTFEVLDAATGNRLYSYDTGADMDATPSIADGAIYIGNDAGVVTALSLPSSLPVPPPDPNCPANFTCQDVGSPSPAGSEMVANTTWTIDAGGTGLGGTSDSFRLLSEPATGDTQVVAQVASQRTSTSQAGVMVRQTTDPGSPYYAVLSEPGGVVAVDFRAEFDGPTATVTTRGEPSLPLYLMIQRVGDSFTAATSSDGSTFTLIPGTNSSLALPTVTMAGLAVASGTSGTLEQAVVDNLGIGPPSTTPEADPPASPCPAGWSCQDSGNPVMVGNQSLTGGTWTLTGAGAGIDNEQTTDQFHFAWQTLPGDATISAEVTSQTDTDPNAAAGLMTRASTAGDGMYYAAFLTPGHGIVVQYRSVAGQQSIQINNAAGAVPAYIQITRSGSTFTTYTSPDGSTWTPVDLSTVTLTGLSGSILGGLVVTSNVPNVPGTATFTNVNVTGSAPQPPNLCPTDWSCADLGVPALPGTQTLTNGSWSVQASGGDIWGTADQFRLISQPFSGNGTVSAQVTSQSDTDPWAKSGVMVRLSDDSTAPYYGVFVTPSNGVVVQFRTEAGAYTGQISAAASSPEYLEIGVTGSTFTAYTSTDDENWQEVPGSSMTINAMTGVLLAGLAVCAHNSAQLNTTVFDNVSMASSGIVGLPSPFADQDIGGATPPGSASFANDVYTVNGGGADIWSGDDQFNYVYQSFSGDGSVIAEVAGQTNTDPYAKSGVMIKQSTTAGSPYAFIGITPGNGVVFQYGYNVSVSGGPYSSGNIWVRLDRQGNTITGYRSNDGFNWTEVGQANVPMTDPITVGLAVTAHNPNVLNTTQFTDVSVTPVGDGPLPSPWTSQDVGSPGVPGDALYTPYNGTFTVAGSGNDIWAANDQFQYVSQPLNGDGIITAQVESQGQTDPYAKSGIMIKQSAAPGAPYALLAVTPGNGIVFQSDFDNSISGGDYAYPEWLSLERRGDMITAFDSPDGVNWTAVGTMTVDLSTDVTVGLVVCSHNNGVLNTTTFDGVSVTAGDSPVNPPWTSQDVGDPGVPGGAAFTNGTFSLSGSGNDIWGANDQFQYVSQPLSGDGTITAEVTSEGNTDPWTKAGIMIKESTSPGAPYALLAVTPGNGVVFQYNFDTSISGGSYTFPHAWLRLQRIGNSFVAYDSPDGVNWSEVGTASISMNQNVTVGLEVCSHNNGVLNTSTFNDVTVTQGDAIPSPWVDQDVGAPDLPGSAGYQNGVFTVNGSGSDVWGSDDQFNYVNQPLSGNGAIVARVTSQTDTDPWAKSGIMIAQSTSAGASYALLAVTPGNGIVFQSNYDTSVGAGSSTSPAWLELTRSGTLVTAYVSPDGVNWTQVGTTTVSLADPVTIGLFVCSHNNGQINTSAFDNVTVQT